MWKQSREEIQHGAALSNAKNQCGTHLLHAARFRAIATMFSVELKISAAFLKADIKNGFETVSVRSPECVLFNKNSLQRCLELSTLHNFHLHDMKLTRLRPQTAASGAKMQIITVIIQDCLNSHLVPWSYLSFSDHPPPPQCSLSSPMTFIQNGSKQKEKSVSFNPGNYCENIS